jgi:hypothetical protein
VAAWIKEKFGRTISVEKIEGEEDEQMVEIDHWIYIAPTTIEKPTILGTLKMPGLMVQVEVVEHNYPREPDWIDVVDVEACTHPSMAVKRAFGIWFETMVENVIENHGITRMIEEEENENQKADGSEAK